MRKRLSTFLLIYCFAHFTITCTYLVDNNTLWLHELKSVTFYKCTRLAFFFMAPEKQIKKFLPLFKTLHLNLKVVSNGWILIFLWWYLVSLINSTEKKSVCTCAQDQSIKSSSAVEDSLLMWCDKHKMMITLKWNLRSQPILLKDVWDMLGNRQGQSHLGIHSDWQFLRLF